MTDDIRFASQADHDERAIQWLFDHARSIKAGQQDLIYHVIALARKSADVRKDDGFIKSDFSDLHGWLMNPKSEKERSALLSNNFNVILAALKRAAALGEKP